MEALRLRQHLRGLRVQIVLWTILPLTLVLIGVAFTGVYSHEQAMRDMVTERDQALAMVSANQIQELLRIRMLALEDLASEQAFHHQQYDEVESILSRASRGSAQRVSQLDRLFSGDLALVDTSSSIIAAGEISQSWHQSQVLKDMVDQIIETEDASISSILPSSDLENAFLMGIPIRDERDTVYGVLTGPVSLDSLGLESLLARARVGQEGVVYLVDGIGQILAGIPPERARTQLAGHTGVDKALQDNRAGATLCHAPDGEKMTMAYAPVELVNTGWRVLVEEPWNEVISPVLRYSQFMPLVAALAVVVSLLTLYYGVRAIVRPLQDLGRRAESVAWGDFEATSTPVGGVQEIEDLRRTLDQMAKRIQSYQLSMHDYIAAITKGQEEERKRLARELHDDTAQSLIALGQRIEMAQKALNMDPERASERLASVRGMLADTIEGVRRFSRNLRPIYLEDLGFIPALEMLVREANQNNSLTVRFSTIGQVHRLPQELELAAYRIAQEALNNTIQHAQATEAFVEVRFDPMHFHLSVHDNGRGFDPPDLPDALARQGHFGLMGIRERVLLWGGRLTLRSTPGEGTTVAVWVPYPD